MKIINHSKTKAGLCPLFLVMANGRVDIRCSIILENNQVKEELFSIVPNTEDSSAINDLKTDFSLDDFTLYRHTFNVPTFNAYIYLFENKYVSFCASTEFSYRVYVTEFSSIYNDYTKIVQAETGGDWYLGKGKSPVHNGYFLLSDDKRSFTYIDKYNNKQFKYIPEGNISYSSTPTKGFKFKVYKDYFYALFVINHNKAYSIVELCSTNDGKFICKEIRNKEICISTVSYYQDDTWTYFKINASANGFVRILTGITSLYCDIDVPDSNFTNNININRHVDKDYYTDFGSTQLRPELPPTGFCYLDQNLNKPIWWNNRWIDSNGNPADAKKQGTTEERPSNVQIGFVYKDTTLHKLILWEGTKWVNLDGTDLT